MKRYIVAAAILLGQATLTYAQPNVAVPGGVPAAPGLPGAAPAANAGAPGNNVTVSNKCCSIWDFLGVNQVGKLVGGAFKTRLGQTIAGFLSPLGRVLGLGPSLLSDKFANEGGAMGLANQLKKEEAKIPLKVQAIRYLATLDCVCYPEVVDALLASLDDCAEVVRYEALKALHKQCKGPTHCNKEGCAADGSCPDVCMSCQCQKKVVDRLNTLLLERDTTGCLKEKSERVRELATQMIEECLSCRQPPPAETAAPPRTDPVPELKSDPVPTAKSSSKNSFIPTWFKWNDPEPKHLEAVPVKEVKEKFEEVPATNADATSPYPTNLAKPSAKQHTSWYRAQPATETTKTEAVVETVQPTAQPKVVYTTPKTKTKSSSSHAPRRHLVGEIFGY
ncbi:MAG: hypothetical protein U1D30_13365 [Planctomycetota bacterium]